MESRIINTVQLRKTGPLAVRQLEVSILCAGLWSQFILDSDDLPEEQRVRAVLKINERIFRQVRERQAVPRRSARSRP